MENKPVCECMGCGQVKACHTAEYGRAVGGQSAARISDLAANTIWESRVTCNLCDDCIGETPRGTYTWIWWLLGISFLLMVFGIYNMSVTARYSQDMPIGFPAIILGWILGMIGAIPGLMKLWGFKTSFLFGFLLGWTPLPAIILLISLKKVNRTVWVDKQMKEKATEAMRNMEDKSKEQLAEISKKDAASLTAEEKKLLEEKRRNASRVAAQERVAQESARQRKSGGAIFGIVITVVIAIVGISTYHTGGYMKWWGIRMSSGGFAALIGAFLVYDIIAIISTRKIRK